MRGVLAIAIVVLVAVPAWANEPLPLVMARAAYNDGNFDAAIASASEARALPGWADTATLVMARAYLERYRLHSDPADLTAGREALESVHAPLLPPREHIDLLVGMGQYLYLSDAFGASAELFDSAVAESYILNGQERLLLLDWWATATDRAAQARPADRRAPLFDRLVTRMEYELRIDPANPVANYWLVIGVRGLGDIERAWDTAIAGWVRSSLWPDAAPKVRTDLDRLVTDLLIPERVRARGAREPEEATEALREEWNTVRAQWPLSGATARDD